MTAQYETALTKLCPLLAALIPFIAATVVFAQRGAVYDGSLLRFTSNDRTKVQILVQIISHIFGFLTVYSLHVLLQLFTRARLFDKPFTLRQFSRWLALSTGHINLSLPWSDKLVALLLVVAAWVPGALWAGAITPFVVLAKDDRQGSISIPMFSNGTADNWNVEFELDGYQLWNQVSNCNTTGVFTNCPVPVLQGTLLDAIGSAWVPDEHQRNHSKIDSIGWTYRGRSYGMGASMGNVREELPALSRQPMSNILAINYTEYGWLAKADCSYNMSTAYGIEAIADAPSGVFAYNAVGWLPNSLSDGSGSGVGENYTLVSSYDEAQELLAWSARSIGGENYIAIASGPGSYSKFNTTQCRINFDAYAFNVGVNYTSMTIEVTPIGPADSTEPNMPPSQITSNAIHSVNLLGRMSSSFYTSVLGNALTQNLALQVTQPTPSDITRSLAAAFETVIDDILVAFGVSQIVMAQDTATIPMYGIGQRVQVGSYGLIYAVFALSVTCIVFQVLCLILSRFWRGLPSFNIFDTKSVVVASSAGSTGLADKLRTNSSQAGYVPVDSEEPLPIWGGDERNKDLLHLEICVESIVHSCDMPRITAAVPHSKDMDDPQG